MVTEEISEQEARALTPKQRLFVEYYLGAANWNASKAARMAGYAIASAHITAQENLKKPIIQAAIQERISEAAMKADEVLFRLADQARGSLDEFLDDDGCFDITRAREAGKMHLLKEYAVEEVYEGGKRDDAPDFIRKVKFKIHDPQAALVHLGRHHKLFTDKVEGTGPDGAFKVYHFNPDTPDASDGDT